MRYRWPINASVGLMVFWMELFAPQVSWPKDERSAMVLRGVNGALRGIVKGHQGTATIALAGIFAAFHQPCTDHIFGHAPTEHSIGIPTGVNCNLGNCHLAQLIGEGIVIARNRQAPADDSGGASIIQQAARKIANDVNRGCWIGWRG